MSRWVAGIPRDLLRAAFRDWFGLQDNQAEVLVTLYEHSGKPISVRELGARVSAHRPLSPNAVWERIRCLRQTLEAESIDTLEDIGYLLTEIGRAECQEAMRNMGIVLYAAAQPYDLHPAEAAKMKRKVA